MLRKYPPPRRRGHPGRVEGTPTNEQTGAGRQAGHGFQAGTRGQARYRCEGRRSQAGTGTKPAAKATGQGPPASHSQGHTGQDRPGSRHPRRPRGMASRRRRLSPPAGHGPMRRSPTRQARGVGWPPCGTVGHHGEGRGRYGYQGFHRNQARGWTLPASHVVRGLGGRHRRITYGGGRPTVGVPSVGRRPRPLGSSSASSSSDEAPARRGRRPAGRLGGRGGVGLPPRESPAGRRAAGGTPRVARSHPTATGGRDPQAVEQEGWIEALGVDATHARGAGGAFTANPWVCDAGHPATS